MSLFVKSKAMAEKMLIDIKRFLFFLTIAVQCVFFIHYIYSIVVNVNRPIFLTVYCVLLFLSLLAFINYLLTYKSPKELLKGISRFLRIFKYFVNFTLIAVNFYGMLNFGTTFWNVFLLILSIISLVSQIFIEVIRYFIELEIKKIKKRQEERKNTPSQNNFNVEEKINALKNKIFKR